MRHLPSFNEVFKASPDPCSVRPDPNAEASDRHLPAIAMIRESRQPGFRENAAHKRHDQGRDGIVARSRKGSRSSAIVGLMKVGGSMGWRAVKLKTTVYLPDDLNIGLKQMAAETGKSQAELIRDGVRLLISQRILTPTIPILVSDDPSFSERVDEHLVGFGER